MVRARDLIASTLLSPSLAGLVHSGTPGGVPETSDCAIRTAAWEYGKSLQPSRKGFRSLYDALQLSFCDVPAPEVTDEWQPLADALPKSQPVLYVDPSDKAAYATVAEAVAVSRAMAKPLTIALRAGTHFLSGTVELGPEDSGLTVRNAPGELAVVSGGVALKTEWKPSTACDGCFEASLEGQVTDVTGLRRDGVREIRARYPNFDEELDSVIDGQHLVHDGRQGWISQTTSWIEKGAMNMNGIPGTWPPAEKAQTYVIEDKDWPDVEWPMHIYTNGTVDPDDWTGEGDWGQYWVGVGGTCIDRSPPAGYWCAPDAPRRISTPNHPSGISPSSDLLPNLPYAHPEGAVIHAWRPGHWYTNTFEVGSAHPTGEEVTAWEFHADSNQISGKCTTPTECEAGILPLGSFKTLDACQSAVNASKTPCASYTYHHIDFDQTWGSYCFCSTEFVWNPKKKDKIDSGRAPGTFNEGLGFMFSRGGVQGGEGVTGGEAWYVENVIEELDMGREWFFDNTSMMLYYKPNGTDTPTGSFASTSQKVLFALTGSQEQPVRDVAIRGLTIRDTALAYFDKHGLPSGGDWALRKDAAIILVGTERVDVGGNLLTRLDGNGVFIGGYNRNLTIRDNEFFGIGDSALAAWGDTSEKLNANGTLSLPWPIGPDGRNGNQPRGTSVLNNVCREIGLWQKQSSLWFQAVTAQTLLKGNVFFNGPRAALNFNDGFGGGDEITENLLLNTCRESSDHGPWNSWDRVPYITEIRAGKPSIIPADRHVHHNFVIGNYNSQEGLDTDDGSSYFVTYDNFFAYADNGLKADFGGHDHNWHGNLLAYVGACYNVFSFKGYNNAFFNNSCIFRGSYGSDCNFDKSWEIHDNRAFSKSGEASICGMSFEDWMASGKTSDHGSTLDKWPADEELVSWVHSLLGMSPLPAKALVI